MGNSSEMPSVGWRLSDQEAIVNGALKGRERYGEDRRTVNVSSATKAGVFSLKSDARMNVPPRSRMLRNLAFHKTFHPQPVL